MKYLKKYNENIEWDWLDEEEYPIPEDFKENERFYNFLKNNNVLEKWIDHFNDKSQKEWRINRNTPADLKEFLMIFKLQPLVIILLNSFDWNLTPEPQFWFKLYNSIKNMNI